MVVADLLARGVGAQRLVQRSTPSSGGVCSALRVSHVRARRHAADPAARGGGQPGERRQARSRRRRAAARSGHRAQPAHRGVRRESRPRGPVAGRGDVGSDSCHRRTVSGSSTPIRRSTRASSRSSSPTAPASCGRSFRRASRRCRRSPIASTSSTPMRNRRMAVSDVILGRVSHVPIITIAVPIVACERRRGRGGRRLARSVEVRALRRRLPDAGRRAHHRSSISTIA